MPEVIAQAQGWPELSLFPAVSPTADGLSVNVQAKRASWLSVAADRRSGGGMRITIDSDGEQVLAEVTACAGEVRECDEVSRVGAS